MANDDLAALGRNELEALIGKLRRQLDLAYKVAEEHDVATDSIMRDFGAKGDDTPRDVVVRLRSELAGVDAERLRLLAKLSDAPADAERAWRRVKLLEARAEAACRKLEGRDG